ncbi:MAG: FAD-dependent oxidoreductase [Chloroflexota bacterium]|nr:FAD-dependent oxidoreductase [Chloroflexota bacterium]
MSENKTGRIVVIGAAAAGLRAAARARRLLPDASITVIDSGKYISYGACGMPYFVSGDIGNADELRKTSYGVIRDPEFFRAAKGLEVIIETRVERIDRDARKVFCKSIITGDTSEYLYDKLVLATGASPIMLPGVSTGSKRITTFKELEDSITLRQSLQKGEIEKIGLIGAGPIGCELAEACGAMWGAEVILIDAAPNILPAIMDLEMARAVETYLASEDIEIHTNCPLEGVTESEDGVIIKTGQGDFEVDHAIFAVGVRPNSHLAADCGLAIGKGGGIIVDEKMTTSDPNIFAAGDCVELKHLITGNPIQLPLGSLANRQGRVIGSNLGGGDERFGPVVGSAAVKIFDMNIAATGLTEKAAAEAGFDVGVSWGSYTHIADYYPDSENLHLKLVYDKSTTRLLGLQGYSKGEVVKRIDVFAALLKHEGKLEDLLDLEFAYAPPYAPALELLNIIGCIARDSLLEGVEALPPNSDISDRLIVDLRREHESTDRPLVEKNILKLPFETFRDTWNQVPKDGPIVCVCTKGIRSCEAVRILNQQGYPDVRYIGGGTLIKLAQK